MYKKAWKHLVRAFDGIKGLVYGTWPKQRWELTFQDPHRFPGVAPIVIGRYWTQYGACNSQVDNLRRYGARAQIRVRRVYGA